MRKLASTQRIVALDPIPGADAIERAKVLGWECVVKRGEFQVGDPCVYIEVDSIVPEKPVFEFLRDRKFRVKTVKLRGQVSQGLALPTPYFPELLDKPFLEDEDITELLGIVKYDPEAAAEGGARLGGDALGLFPAHLIPKTDEVRIQSVPHLLTELVGREVYVTIKRDGTSATFYTTITDDNGSLHFGVCSRNRELKDSKTAESRIIVLPNGTEKVIPPKSSVYWDKAYEHKLPEQFRELCLHGYALQGEIFGPGIQKNRMGAPGLTLEIFSGWSIQNHKYMGYEELKWLCEKLDLKLVPLVWRGIFTEEMATVPYLVNWADSVTYENGSPAEGLVIRPVEECVSEALRGERMSCKVISPKFLLHHGI